MRSILILAFSILLSAAAYASPASQPVSAVKDIVKIMSEADSECEAALESADRVKGSSERAAAEESAAFHCQTQYETVFKIAKETRGQLTGIPLIIVRGYEKAARIYMEAMKSYGECFKIPPEIAKYHRADCIDAAKDRYKEGFQTYEVFADKMIKDYLSKMPKDKLPARPSSQPASSPTSQPACPPASQPARVQWDVESGRQRPSVPGCRCQ